MSVPLCEYRGVRLLPLFLYRVVSSGLFDSRKLFLQRLSYEVADIFCRGLMCLKKRFPRRRNFHAQFFFQLLNIRHAVSKAEVIEHFKVDSSGALAECQAARETSPCKYETN